MALYDDIISNYMRQAYQIQTGAKTPQQFPEFKGIYESLMKMGEDEKKRLFQELSSRNITGGALTQAMTPITEQKMKGGLGTIQNMYAASTNLPVQVASQQQQRELQQKQLGQQWGMQSRELAEARKMRHMQREQSQLKAGCCFIFIEGEGEIIEPVRKFRDSFFSENSYVGKGYKRMARWLVPLMKKNSFIKWAVKNIMTKPMSKFAEHYYNDNKKGLLYTPIGLFWCFIWGHSARLEEILV